MQAFVSKNALQKWRSHFKRLLPKCLHNFAAFSRQHYSWQPLWYEDAVLAMWPQDLTYSLNLNTTICSLLSSWMAFKSQSNKPFLSQWDVKMKPPKKKRKATFTAILNFEPITKIKRSADLAWSAKCSKSGLAKHVFNVFLLKVLNISVVFGSNNFPVETNPRWTCRCKEIKINFRLQ